MLYSDVSVDHVTVRDSASTGIYTSASSPLITDCVVENNATAGIRVTRSGVAGIRGCRVAGDGQSGSAAVETRKVPWGRERRIRAAG